MTSDNSSFSELGELSLTPEQLIQIKSEVDYRLYQGPSRFSTLTLEVSSELGLSPSTGDLDLLFRKYQISLAPDGLTAEPIASSYASEG